MYVMGSNPSLSQIVYRIENNSPVYFSEMIYAELVRITFSMILWNIKEPQRTLIWFKVGSTSTAKFKF